MTDWRPIPSFQGFYEASRGGHIRAVGRPVRFVDKNGQEHWRQKAPRPLATSVINSGYLVAWLCVDGIRTAKTVHSLVAEAFIGPRPAGADVCHNNGNRLDNRPENLRYDTRSANHLDRVAHGTIYLGATQAKLSAASAAFIRGDDDGTAEFVKRTALTAQVTPRTIRRILRRETWKHEI